jgi:O-acetyl-ADP-ribose deacetylase (regulator of RNase III)
VAGDLFAEPGLDALAHGCNCAGSMSGGIAVAFKKRWPNMHAEYARMCADGRFALGDVFAWREDDLVIFNLGTQDRPGPDATLGAIEDAVRRMIRLAPELGVTRIGLPRIGAGVGGLAWQDVRTLLETIGASTAIELVVFEDYRPSVTESGAPA